MLVANIKIEKPLKHQRRLGLGQRNANMLGQRRPNSDSAELHCANVECLR